MHHGISRIAVWIVWDIRLQFEKVRVENKLAVALYCSDRRLRRSPLGGYAAVAGLTRVWCLCFTVNENKRTAYHAYTQFKSTLLHEASRAASPSVPADGL